jgi:rhamnogalacturonyl hydrolase YesR
MKKGMVINMEESSRYFDDGQDIASICGTDTHKILRTIAARYIGQNPPHPFGFHVYHKDGFLCRPDGRFDLTLKEKQKEAKFGEITYLCAKFWKADSGSQPFLLSCYGPVDIYINGKQGYRSTVREDVNVAIQKTVDLNYEAGWNLLVIKCTNTASGYGCIFGTADPRWNWVSFQSPFEERAGQLGFVYSESLEDGKELDSKVISISMDASEETTDITWYPKREWEEGKRSLHSLERIYGIRMGVTACGWSSVKQTIGDHSNVRIRLKSYGMSEVYLDGTKILSSDQNSCIECDLPYGSHSVLVTCKCTSNEKWGYSLEIVTEEEQPLIFELPCNLQGTKDPWLYLGTLERFDTDALGTNMLYQLYGVDNKVYWQVDEPNSYVRPVLENQLFGRWNYPLGVTLYGLMATSRILESDEILQYVTAHIRECVSLYEYSVWDAEQYGYPEINNQLVELKMLDDCGSFGSAMLELGDTSLQHFTMPIAEKIANHMTHLQERKQNGAFYRRCPGHYMENTLWVDDLYMSVPFLCRYYQISGNADHLEDAVNQYVQFKKYLFIPEYKVMSHVYDFKYNTDTKLPWGRGNGWCFFSLSELLAVLPREHERYSQLLEFFTELAEGYLASQGSEGLWHQLLTHPDSYEESSCTAMFVYALCRGVRYGWLKNDILRKAIDAIHKGWEGLTRKSIDRQGNIHGICGGSAYSFTSNYYKNELLWITNDPHGIGIVLLAGIETQKIKAYLRNEREQM